MGREKKYGSAAALSRALHAYFASISRVVPAQEYVDEGKKDAWGHTVYALKNVVNDAGEQIYKREYITPPSVSGICEALSISRQTWNKYCKEYEGVAERARMKIESYLVSELIARKKGSVQGIIFNLQNNFGWGGEKKELELSEKTRRAMQLDGMSMAEKIALIQQAAKGAEAADGSEDN